MEKYLNYLETKGIDGFLKFIITAIDALFIPIMIATIFIIILCLNGKRKEHKYSSMVISLLAMCIIIKNGILIYLGCNYVDTMVPYIEIISAAIFLCGYFLSCLCMIDFEDDRVRYTLYGD